MFSYFVGKTPRVLQAGGCNDIGDYTNTLSAEIKLHRFDHDVAGFKLVQTGVDVSRIEKKEEEERALKRSPLDAIVAWFKGLYLLPRTQHS